MTKKIRCEAERPAIGVSALKTQVQLRALLRLNSLRGMVTVERTLLPGSLEKKRIYLNSHSFTPGSVIIFCTATKLRDLSLQCEVVFGDTLSFSLARWTSALMLAL